MSNEYPVTSVMKVADGSSVKIEYHKMLYSTAELAKKYASEGYPDRYVVFTDAQATSRLTGTKLGDGELERGVFISCLLRPSFFPAQTGLIGHLTAISVVQALDEHTTKELGLGWVTDIYCEGVRIGGCSIEGKLNSKSSYEYLIVTIGLRLDKESFPPRLTDMIKKVFEEDNTSLTMIIAKSILNKLFSTYSNLRHPGKHMDAYCRRFLLSGRRLKVNLGDKKQYCKVLRVDKSSGTLFVENKRGETVEIKSPSMVSMPKKIKLK